MYGEEQYIQPADAASDHHMWGGELRPQEQEDVRDRSEVWTG